MTRSGVAASLVMSVSILTCKFSDALAIGMRVILMGRMNYPEPHPYRVAGMKSASTWGYVQPIPSREDFAAYMVRQGLDAAGYDAWVARVETVKANNARDSAARRTLPVEVIEVAASAPEVPLNSAAVGSAMAHRQAKAEAGASEVMSVRVRPGINGRLARYAAHYGARKQEVVSDVLADFLKREGF